MFLSDLLILLWNFWAQKCSWNCKINSLESLDNNETQIKLLNLLYRTHDFCERAFWRVWFDLYWLAFLFFTILNFHAVALWFVMKLLLSHKHWLHPFCFWIFLDSIGKVWRFFSWQIWHNLFLLWRAWLLLVFFVLFFLLCLSFLFVFLQRSQ